MDLGFVLLQLNAFNEIGSLYKPNVMFGLMAGNPAVTPEEELQDNDGAFLLDNDSVQLIDNT